MSGYSSGTLTPNGLRVAARHLRMWVRRMSGYMLPDPMRPRAPALLTALASSQPLHQIMPAWTMGFSMLKSLQIRLFFIDEKRGFDGPEDTFICLTYHRSKLRHITQTAVDLFFIFGQIAPS